MYQSRDFGELEPLVFNILRTARPYTDAVVLDIDATVLYNAPGSLCGADLNVKMQKVYDYCKRHDILVFFVTARVDTTQNQNVTTQQLQCMGFDTYAGLYMRPPWVNDWAKISQFKANCRRHIAQKHKIVLNVGDAWSDVHEVTDSKSLTNAYTLGGGRNILFKPHDDPTTVWALKLEETRQ